MPVQTPACAEALCKLRCKELNNTGSELSITGVSFVPLYILEAMENCLQTESVFNK